MIIGAGGIDKLSSGLDAYFEMLSSSEQATELTRRMTEEFANLGLELPTSIEAYKKLVNSFDVTTEAGQTLYGQVIALAPEFQDLVDAIESANSEVNSLVESLRDLAEQAQSASGETEALRTLEAVRAEMATVSALAMSGDTDAANKLLTLSSTLMSLSSSYATTTAEYARDLALIQRSATVAADTIEAGLGTTTETSLTPTTGVSTTTTTDTATESTTDTKLTETIETLQTGFFTLAKSLQSMESKLDRWDDGTRMLVGIAPETGDVPQPVVATV